MTLVKSRARPPAHHKKVSGDHHNKSRRYLKTYWPYIPLLLVLGSAFLANQYLPESLAAPQANSASVYNSRAQSLLGSNNAYTLDLMYIAFGVLAFWFLVRHFKRFRSVVLNSEKYLARHYVMDIMLGMALGSIYILVH